MIPRVILFFGLLSAAARADDSDFFEKNIRPLFSEHCTSCHGEKKQSAGLRLDTVAGIRSGADNGPVINAGNSKQSRLMKAVRHQDGIAMPPNKKLTDQAIALLDAWIEHGATMPKESVAANSNAKSHWAFQPIRRDIAGDVDTLVAAKLKEKGLCLSPPADPRTLLRRVYFDLIGLPPTFEQITAFENNPSSYERVVDELLASPHYGERWARHWLDVARYADTKGYVFTEDRNYPYAYTYRDYVIRSFNEDKPFDRFIVEQIAADHLPSGPDNRTLAALGFLTVGRRFNNNLHDIIDDRIEVVTRGFLGLSVGCARCHDHKFDPIPIADYYSLYGVFASSIEPKELPMLDGYVDRAAAEKFNAELTAMEKAAEDFYARMTRESLAKFRSSKQIAEYLLAVRDFENLPPNQVDAGIKERNLYRLVFDRWKKAITRHPHVFDAWNQLARLDTRDFSGKYLKLVSALQSNASLTPAIVESLNDASPKNLKDVADLYGDWLANGDEVGTAILNAVLKFTPEESETLIPVIVKREYRKLRNAAQALRATSPLSPPRAMVLQDAPRPTEPIIFLRGNPENHGSKVPRRFLGLFNADRQPFANGSGRIDLAHAIADPKNPLTARVIVNRVWAWHFGQGLVRTPSDFGVRSEPPSHPELLDWLADQFLRDGWSLKRLHRRIVLSATYRQSSTTTARILAADPDNRLLSRSPRKRLEFEPLRDALLAAAGTLDLSKIGGRSEDILRAPFSNRRTVYAFIERQNLPGTFRAFDFANPDHHTPQRYLTTVPQQALYMMNSEFISEVARNVMRRPEIRNCETDTDCIASVYRVLLGRNPSAHEIALALEYTGTAPVTTGKLGPWEQWGQAILMSNEFTFVD